MGRSPTWRLSLVLLAWFLVRAAGDEPFRAMPTHGPVPLPVQFTDTSPGNPTAWLWYFGDEDFAAARWHVFEVQGLADGTEPGCATVLPDGSILLTGGHRFVGTSGLLMNEVWRSEDCGATWQQLAENAPWPPRVGHSCVVLADGTVVLMEGLVGSSTLGVWESSDRGETWSEVVSATTSQVTARVGQACVALADGGLLVVGGREGNNARHDVWRTDDHGRTWSEICPDADWSERYDHACTLLPDGGIVLTGGRSSQGTLLDDVWRSDDQGATWTLAAEHAPWAARWGHLCVALADGSMILARGFSGLSKENGIWRSVDGGLAWQRLNRNPAWHCQGRCLGVLAHDGSLLLMALNSTRQDIWRFPTAGSTEQSPRHTYRRPGTYDVVMQTYGYHRAVRSVRQRYIVALPSLTGSVQEAEGTDSEPAAAAEARKREASPKPSGKPPQPAMVASETGSSPAVPEPSPASPEPPGSAWQSERVVSWSHSPPVEPIGGSEDEQLGSDCFPQTPLRFLPLVIVALSLILFLIGCKRHAGEPLGGRLYTAHVVSLALLSLVEIGYVVALREDSFWFCLYGTMGWQKVAILCFLFCVVLVNQALCHVYALRDLCCQLDVVVPWWWGLLSLPIALVAAIYCALACRPALVVVGILFGVAQLVQVGQLVYAVVPTEGRARTALSVMLYLVWTGGLTVAAVVLLGLSLFSLVGIGG